MDENHKRALKSGLQVVERHLHYISSQLQSHVNRSASYSTRNDIDVETKTKVSSLIETMLDEIEQIMEKFSLESRQESIKNNIRGSLTEIWTVLEESRPEKLNYPELKLRGFMSVRLRIR